ncbi:MAG TPA: glycosyltransferase family 2 protein [Candidatus Acidoferrum sp.]|jgi:glycosyltransferase involved in cell wall biosynthesis
MHIFGLLFFGAIALFWLTYGLDVAYGAVRLPWLSSFASSADSDCPRISLIFAARDEEEKLPAALTTLIEIDYPNLEIIAVDDRSQDATSRILDEFASTHNRLKVVHINELPAGWLGKPHALQKAYETSTGEWLLFTDADVRFKLDTLRRCATLLRALELDHLTLFGDVEMVTFWEKVIISFFGMSFHLAIRPHRVTRPHSRAYVGVGAFQMVKRTTYEACGAHRRLAMEVIDDVQLGKMIKLGGFRSGVALAQDAVSVRWHAGLSNLVRGVEKNFFAAAHFRLSEVFLQALTLLSFNVAPLFGVLFAHGWVRVFAAIGLLIPICFLIGVDTVMRISPFYALTLPLAAVVFTYMLLRSAFITLKQGGIYWRGTFYPLKDLRRNHL